MTMRRVAVGSLCCLVCFAALARVAIADDYVWRNVKVGGGGFAPSIVFSRVERGLAYLRTDMGGAYRWDAADRSWKPLEDSIAQSSYFGIESIAADPVDANVVYLAAGMYRREDAAILRSHDRGNTWEVFPTTFRMGGNEDGRGLGERLAIDPNLTSTLYFGSRHDGLQRSRDSGRTWSAVAAFPVRGRGLPPLGQKTNAGISFVVIEPASGSRGMGSRTVFVGVADPGEQHLYRSDDGGETWSAIAGQPGAGLLPVQAELDAGGVLYVTFSNGVGPTGVTAGAVFKYDTRSGRWGDITPGLVERGPAGGYMGLSVDRQRLGTLVVASMNRWNPGDTIWRSTDGGRSWISLREVSRHDVSATPFLRWGRKQADFGWWIAGIAIDPFDSNFVAYTTGATVYATHDVASKKVVSWAPWVEGVEQTAILTLTSPPEGPSLLSGFGDISGFAHETLNVSPTTQFTSPIFSNTNTIDYAGRAPQIVVRSGTPEHRMSPTEATLAFSTDYGRSWGELPVPSTESLAGRSGDAAVVTSADGSAFIVMTPVPSITRDRGRGWASVRGLSPSTSVIADRVDPRSFYALDFEHSTLLVSTDGGSTFASVKTIGLPADIRDDRPRSSERPWPLLATPGKAGDLWFVARGGLLHSTDAGRSFGLVRSPLRVEALGFGKAPPGRDNPALFAIGVRDEARAIWRSDNDGATWVRLNDSRHEYGQRFRCIAGDPRVFGRVYVGTDGRGIVYGEPSSAAAK